MYKIKAGNKKFILKRKSTQDNFAFVNTGCSKPNNVYEPKTHSTVADKDFTADLNQQIVSVTDKYSALREARSYKAKMTKEEALTIIHKDVAEGKLHPFIFKALVDYANSLDNTAEISVQRLS